MRMEQLAHAIGVEVSARIVEGPMFGRQDVFDEHVRGSSRLPD